MMERPVDLNLWAMRFPITAIISIVHRITGIVLFLGFPVLIWIWSLSLSDVASFNSVILLIENPLMSCALWIYLSCFGYHILAGCKHLVMDLGFAEELRTARLLSWMTLLAAGLLALIFFYLFVSSMSVTNLTRSGLADWLVQRLSAVVLLFYVGTLLVFFLSHPVISYVEWHEFFSHLAMQVFSFLAVIAALAHIWIGLWTVFTDYINIIWLRLLLQAVLVLLLSSLLTWVSIVIWHL